MPPALTRPGVERQEAGREEVVPRVKPASEVVRGRVGGDVDVDEAAFEVGGEQRPGGQVAGPSPGVVLPGV